jgi:WD40 repeat protein
VWVSGLLYTCGRPIRRLCRNYVICPNSNDTISSVAWAQKVAGSFIGAFLRDSDSRFKFQGSTLAVGTLSGRLHIYDANTLQPLRTYNQAHNQRVGAISWNRSVLSSGSRDRMIYHRDIRERDTKTVQEVRSASARSLWAEVVE